MSRQINEEYSATVISIVPFVINEFKPGVYPGTFSIPAAKDNEPEVLVVGESVFHVEIAEDRSITVRCPPNDIARAIVQDHINSSLAYSEEDDACPGLMWKFGTFTKNDVKVKFAKELEDLKSRQWKWFIKLVKMADDDWEKTRQHRTISDMQRHACKALGQERPWIINAPESTAVMMANSGLINCVACQSTISKQAVICPNCKMIIDEAKWKTLKFAEVK